MGTQSALSLHASSRSQVSPPSADRKMPNSGWSGGAWATDSWPLEAYRVPSSAKTSAVTEAALKVSAPISSQVSPASRERMMPLARKP